MAPGLLICSLALLLLVFQRPTLTGPSGLAASWDVSARHQERPDADRQFGGSQRGRDHVYELRDHLAGDSVPRDLHVGDSSGLDSKGRLANGTLDRDLAVLLDVDFKRFALLDCSN